MSIYARQPTLPSATAEVDPMRTPNIKVVERFWYNHAFLLQSLGYVFLMYAVIREFTQ